MARGAGPLTIAFLADHPEHVATIARWFAAQWPDYYAGRGVEEIEAEIGRRLHRDRIPLALLAFAGDGGREPVGTVSVQLESIQTHRHLGPWIGGLYVAPPARSRGLAMALVERGAAEARRLGATELHIALHAAADRYEAAGWTVIDRTEADGEPITVLRRPLDAQG